MTPAIAPLTTADLRSAVDDVVERLATVVPDGRTLLDSLPGEDSRTSSTAAAVGSGALPWKPPRGHPTDEQADDGSLTRVAAAFDLDENARHVLVLCAAVELDERAARLVEHATRGRGVTVGLALRIAGTGSWGVVVPTAPLRAHRLVDVAPGPLTSASIAIDERVLHALCGVPTLDARLLPRLREAERGTSPPTGYVDVVRAIRVGLAGTGAVQVVGGPDADRLVLAIAALDPTRPAWTTLSTELPTSVEEQDAFARLWNRELRLDGGALVIEMALDAGPAHQHTVARLVRRLDGQVVLAAPGPIAGGPAATVPLPRLTAADQRTLWRDHLDDVPGALAAAELAVERFDLGWQPIVDAARLVTVDPPSADALHGVCTAAVHAVVRPAFDGLAQQVAPTASRDRLAVPPTVEAVLDDIVRHVRRRRQVHDDWGFGGSRGRGVTAVFAGPSGTGKTLAAEVLATELDLELWRVDLSAVVSKYIGETEKQLRRLLDAAEAGTVLLLFDEADALFGSRTEVRDSHDRYANQEVSYLLQRLETFRGLAVLTTNMRAAIDEAFLRRFRFVATFPFPDARLREAIWDAVVPAVAPFAPLDRERLARLELTGGHLHNVAVSAAVLGADDGGVVLGDHVRRAVRLEYAKLGRTLTSSEEAALVASTRGAAEVASTRGAAGRNGSPGGTS